MQRAKALNQQIADETAQLVGLQRIATRLRAETAAQSAIETQLAAARDTLKAVSSSVATSKEPSPDGSAQRDRVADEVVQAKTVLAQTKSALDNLRAQLKIESDIANAPRPTVPAPTGTDAGPSAAP